MSPTSLRVAILESDVETRQSLQQMIHDLGHEVISIMANGAELIDCCARLRPDVILTGSFALELSERDTVTSETRQIPVILYADHCDRDLVLNAEHKQVFMYLVKPLRQEHLKVALDGCRLQRIRRPLSDDTEDYVVPIAGSHEYSGNTRYSVHSGRSYSSMLAPVAR